MVLFCILKCKIIVFNLSRASYIKFKSHLTSNKEGHTSSKSFQLKVQQQIFDVAIQQHSNSHFNSKLSCFKFFWFQEDILHDKSELLSKLSQYSQTVCHRTIYISNQIIVRLREIIRYFEYFFILFDKAIWSTGTTMISLKCATTGIGIFLAIENCLGKIILDLEIRYGISTDKPSAT